VTDEVAKAIAGVREQLDATPDLPSERHVEEALYGMVVNMRPNSQVEQLQQIAATAIKRLVILQENS
jgi:hypothetical protein